MVDFKGEINQFTFPSYKAWWESLSVEDQHQYVGGVHWHQPLNLTTDDPNENSNNEWHFLSGSDSDNSRIYWRLDANSTLDFEFHSRSCACTLCITDDPDGCP